MPEAPVEAKPLWQLWLTEVKLVAPLALPALAAQPALKAALEAWEGTQDEALRLAFRRCSAGALWAEPPHPGQLGQHRKPSAPRERPSIRYETRPQWAKTSAAAVAVAVAAAPRPFGWLSQALRPSEFSVWELPPLLLPPKPLQIAPQARPVSQRRSSSDQRRTSGSFSPPLSSRGMRKLTCHRCHSWNQSLGQSCCPNRLER